ncbi:MAG: protein kinase [Planctomycetes bacterium]|nr:protein kinase [Planctomycetota bacterium]
MLDDAQKDRLMDLFAVGAGLPAAERAGFVARECGDDPAVQEELAELLEVEAAELAGFLVAPAVAAPADPAAATGGPAVLAPRGPLPQIEGYTDFERIADGGMGSVYKAQQRRPVRREVAIKLIRTGLDSDDVLARFAAERQALALMSHPYIASVHDAGVDALGRPFLVMEFVDGPPINEFCDGRRLPLDDRLRLFVKVCRAVEHAHRRGVLHRDLKPSNVLVSGRGDEAMPKIIDFGIAKALEGTLGERSIHTLEGSFLGTPEYMAPEQIEGSVQRIDTRSDVYSLGVLLYELIVGARPIDATRLRDASVVKVTQIVRDSLPPKPSTRLRGLLAAGTGAVPTGDDARWLRRLCGDLDWIVMKALEKEPDRRYGSARELAEDLDNFLSHRPVSAGPPSGLYQLRKFARRYRVQFAAGVLVLLSLVLGLTGTLWFLVESKRNEADAVRRARQAEGVRIAAEAALIAPADPNLALLLALEASALTDDVAVRRSIYDALPQHALRRRLIGHDQGIDQGGGVLVQYLADGRLLDSGASDAVLWDADAGTQLRRFVGPRDSLSALVIDPGERLLLGGSYDGRAYLWDLATGALLRVIEDHGDELRGCAFAVDGSRFATSSLDGTARVFATGGDRVPLVLEHGVAVGAVAFMPDGERLVTFAADRRMRVWDLATGRSVLASEAVAGPPIGAHATRGTELFLAAGIERVAVSCEGTIRVFATDGRSVAGIDAMLPRRYGEDRLLVGLDGRLGVIDLRTGGVERLADVPLTSAMPSPDGRFAVGVGETYDHCLLDLSSMQIVRRYLGPADRSPRPPIAFHPDGKRFAVLAPEVRIWDLKPEFAPFDLPDARPGPQGQSAAWGDDPIAVVRAADGPGGTSWDVWDVAARRRSCTIQRPGLSFVEPVPGGAMLLGGISANDHSPAALVVFDVAGRPLHEIPLPARPAFGQDLFAALRRAVDASGRLLVTTEATVGQPPLPLQGALLQVHDLQTGALVSEIPHPGGVPTWVGAPDTGLVAMAGWQLRFLEVLDWRTGEVRARVSRPPDGMHLEAAVSPDGRYLLGTLGEPLAFVWDLHSAGEDLSDRPLVTYTGLESASGYPCGFVADGRLCWVACGDDVHLFETVTGRVFTVLHLSGNFVGLAESPDGAQLLTQTIGGRVQRFPLDPVAAARRMAVGQLDGKQLAQYRIGTPEQRRAAERVFLVANVSPGNQARLGRMALADGDLDAAIACYERGAGLGVLGPYYEYLYREQLELLCRRLAVDGDPADRAAALVALERALLCGASRAALLALPGIDALRASPRFEELLGG